MFNYGSSLNLGGGRWSLGLVIGLYIILFARNRKECLWRSRRSRRFLVGPPMYAATLVAVGGYVTVSVCWFVTYILCTYIRHLYIYMYIPPPPKDRKDLETERLKGI